MAVTNLMLLFGGIALLLLVRLVVLTVRSHKVPDGLRAVPGPKGVPVLGNTLQLGARPQEQLERLAGEYGELFQMKIGWENWIFVNSPEAVKEIFDKQSATTSGRVPMPVASDLVSGGMRFLFMSYTPRWRKLRAIVHKLLTPKVSNTFRPSQEFEAKQLVFQLLTDNQNEQNFYMHVRRYTTSVVMTSTYGRRIPVWDCEDIREVYGLMKDFSDAAAPGAYIADLLPPLAKLPVWMQWWRASALRLRDRQAAIWMKYWTSLKKEMENGSAPDCFVKHFIETDFEKQGISELQGAFVAGTMIEAGSETTSSALNSCIKYLAAYPDKQARAHAELDSVLPSSMGRTPSFSDAESLPYIRAMVKEILRLKPVASIGSPHYTTSPVQYKDYYIPAGTVVSVNQWGLHFDPARFPDPHAFNPDRYLDHPLNAGAYTAHPDPYARDHFSFGAGRRICPGMHLAENSLFITLAKILWAFEIRPPLRAKLPGDGRGGVEKIDSGKKGKEEEETVDVSANAYEPGVNTLPKPYRIRFLPRSLEKEKVVRDEWDAAINQGDGLGSVRVGPTDVGTK